MTIEQLREVYKTEPFQPFSLHLADGRRLEVPHPEFIASAPKGRTVIVFGEGDSFSIIDLLLVTRIEVNPADTPKQNGEMG